MHYKYPYPQPIDKSLFRKDKIGEPLYGLPKHVKFCTSCVISNQRPSSTVEFKNDGKSTKEVIEFDKNNECDACKVKSIKEQIDWKEREQELRDLCNKYRKNDGSYDCLVPGSGGKDSFMQAHLLKYKYDMNPLTCTWAPHIYTDWGWKNHQAWIHAGFDNVLFTPNGKVHKLLTRIAIENLFHPFQPFILGQKNISTKIALQNNIQLIFYGENEAEYGNKKSLINTSQRSKEFYSKKNNSNIYIGGSSIEELKELSLRNIDLEPYLPIDENKLSEKNIQVHYLGYFEKWHPQSAYYYAVKHGGFQSSPERTVGTYSTYNSIDDRIDDFHYHTTYLKFGIGRATYDASQEIRSGDITREEGVALVRKYDGEYPKRWAEEIFEYLSIKPELFPHASKHFEETTFSKKYYFSLADHFRSPHLWQWTEENGWELRRKVSDFTSAKDQKDTAHNWKGNKSIY
tara:strand:- start:2946 stop:4319 length:1374 start_codon:yes stop_codon:yes gene_type:complete